LDNDKLNSIKAGMAVQAAFQAVDAIQQFPSHQQVAGVAVLFTAITDGLGVCPSELIDKGQRISKDADTYFTREVKALREYIKGELKK